MVTEVGGPIYIGDTPGGESFPEYDSTIDKNQIVKNSVVAGPITCLLYTSPIPRDS